MERNSELWFTQFIVCLLVIFCLCLAVQLESQRKDLNQRIDYARSDMTEGFRMHSQYFGRIDEARYELNRLKRRLTPPDDPPASDLPEPENDPVFVLPKRLRFRIE